MFKDVSKWSFSDRFIPRRSAADCEYFQYLINNSDTEECWEEKSQKLVDFGIVLTAKRQYNRQNYSLLIRSILLPRERKVLEFSNQRRPFLFRNDESKDSWPVIPRSKPLLREPCEILDMPNLETGHCRQVVDWSKKGFLSAIYEGEVYMWHPSRGVSERFTTSSANAEYCIKWNFDGTMLAITSKNSTIAIMDFPTLKIKAKIKCFCYTCAVTSIAWTSTNALVSGCSYGWLCTWTSNLQCTSYLKLHFGEIINVKLSLSGNYVVTTGIDGSFNLLVSGSRRILMKFQCLRSVKAVDWHPWRNSLLAVVEDSSLCTYNVNNLEKIECKRYPSDTIFDCMTFNPISAELVVGYCMTSENIDGSMSRLSVLKNIDTAVDEVHYMNGRQTCLLWDNTGTKLATVTSDENLSIWDFFGTSSTLRNKFVRRPTRRPSIFKMLNESSKNCLGIRSGKLAMFETLQLLGGKIR